MALQILLMEDNPAKKNRLLAFLDGERGTDGRVDTALCTVDAVRLMKERQYDLFIADLVIPRELGGEEHEKHAIDLFEEVDEELGGIRRPFHSLTISAAGEISETANQFFRGRPWGVLQYNESNNECLETIKKVCAFVGQEKKQLERDIRQCDVFVVCALLEPEFVAIEKLALDWSPLQPLDSTQLVRFGSLKTPTRELRIAAAFCPRMGAVQAAVLVSKAMMMLKPRLVLMSGICAGIPGKANIGDVIAADISWDWQSGKYIDKNGIEAFEISPHQVNLDDAMRNQMVLLKRDEAFWTSLTAMALKAKATMPKLVLGPMATGASVLADARVTARIKTTQHKNVVGLDMEAYGVYVAAISCDPKVRVVSLKSVCDKGDLQKNDEHQEYAASVAASALYQFLYAHAEPVMG